MKLLGLSLLGIILTIIAISIIRSRGNTADTIHKEFSASALLKKYE